MGLSFAVVVDSDKSKTNERNWIAIIGRILLHDDKQAIEPVANSSRHAKQNIPARNYPSNSSHRR